MVEIETEADRFFKDAAGELLQAKGLISANQLKPSAKSIQHLHVPAMVHVLYEGLKQTQPEVLAHPDTWYQMPQVVDMVSQIGALYRKSGSKLDDDDLASVLGEFMQRAWHRNMWLTKQKTYAVSPGVGELLLYTQISGVPAEAVRTPYPSVYVSVPMNLFEFLPTEAWTHEHGGYMVLDDNLPDEMVNQENDVYGLYLNELVIDGVREWHVLVCGRPRNKVKTMDGYSYDFSGMSFMIPMTDGVKLSTIINDVIKKENRPDKAMPLWAKIFIWLVNVMLYISAPEAELMPGYDNKEFQALLERSKKATGAKKEKILAQLKPLRSQSRPRIYVGPSVRATEIRAKVEELQAKHGKKKGLALIRKVIVPGHWRRKEAEKGWVSDNVIRIESYERYKDALQESNKVHELTVAALEKKQDAL